MEQLDTLAAAVGAADLAPVRPQIAHAIRVLRKNGIVLSDRRAVKAQRLVAAAGVMAGRATPSEADLWPLVTAVPTLARARRPRGTRCAICCSRSESTALAAGGGGGLPGPGFARAARIVEAEEEALRSRPAVGDAEVQEAWRPKLEGVAREIDATFAAPSLPEAVASLRARIVAELGG